jgi:hypothetical protein
MRDRASCRDPQETVAAEPRHVSHSALCASRWRILRQKFLPTLGGKPGSCRDPQENSRVLRTAHSRMPTIFFQRFQQW